MKIRIAMKYIKDNYDCINIGMNGQNLMSKRRENFYTSGIYGWNADVYIFDDIAIIQGDRAFGWKAPYELIKEYDYKAKMINNDYDKSYEEKKNFLYDLIKEFINDCKELKNV